MFYLYYSIFQCNFAAMITSIKIENLKFFSPVVLKDSLGFNAMPDLLQRILNPVQRSVSISSAAKVLNISVEDIMIILSNNGIKVGTGYLPRLAESHLNILWKVYSRKLNGYVNTSFNNICKIDRDEFNDISLYYSYFKKSTNNIENDILDFIDEPQYYHWLRKKQDNKKTSHSEYIKYHIEFSPVDKYFNVDSDKLKEAFFDLIYQEENRTVLIDNPESYLHSSQISSWVTWLSPEIKNETNESRKILSKIIKKLSLHIKIKVRNVCNFISSIIILIILSCRYYIFVGDDEYPRAAKKLCASWR